MQAAQARQQLQVLRAQDAAEDTSAQDEVSAKIARRREMARLERILINYDRDNIADGGGVCPMQMIRDIHRDYFACLYD